MVEERNINNTDEEGVSLGEICSLNIRKKILGLIIFIVLAILSFVAILIYSGRQKEYVINFDYGTTPNLSSGTYLDGSVFNYLNIVSETTLNYVKENSDQYNDLDIPSMLKSISISKTISSETIGDETVVTDNYYVIKVSANEFASVEQAKNFLIDLVNLPLKKNEVFLNNLDFEGNYTLINNSLTYEEEVSYLQSQVSLISNGYASLIDTFGNINVYMEETDSGLVMTTSESSTYSLSQLQNKFKTGLGNFNYSYLDYILEANNYVKLDANGSADYYVSLYTSRISALENQNTILTKRIESLTSQINGVMQGQSFIDSSALSSLVNERSGYEQDLISNQTELERMNKVLERIETEAAKPEGERFLTDIAFGESLDDLYSYIKAETTTYTSVYKELYDRIMQVNYRQANVIATDGGISIAINIGISIVLGLIVGCLVAGIAGYNSTKKRQTIDIKTPESVNKE